MKITFRSPFSKAISCNSKFVSRAMALFILVCFAFPYQSNADITQVVNSTVFNSGTTTRDVVVQRGISNEIEVRGTWIDITSKIEFRQGATVFTVPKTSNSGAGVNPAWMKFNVNRTNSGRFSVTLQRAGGQDVFNVFFTNAPTISNIQYFVGASATPIASNNPTILPSNTRIRMVTTGGGLGGLSVFSLGAFFTTQQPQSSTKSVTSCTFEYTTDRRTTLSVLSASFSAVFGNQNPIPYNRFVNNRRWAAPTHSVKVLKAPDLAFDGQPINVFNLKANSFCNIADTLQNNFSRQRTSIENPIRCANGTFNIPAPSQASPVTSGNINWPALQFTVKNFGEEASVATTVQFKNGINVIQTVNIPAIPGGGTFRITFQRPNSVRKLTRVLNSCPDCYDTTLDSRNWTDLPMQLVIDPVTGARPTGLVNESGTGGETNNTFQFLGTQTL